MGNEDFVNEALIQNLYWLRFGQEHAKAFRMGLPCERTDLIRQAKEFEELFGAQLNRAHSLPPTSEAIRELNEESIDLSLKFIDYQTLLIGLLHECKLPGGSLYPRFVAHVREESEYFIMKLRELMAGGPADKVDALLRDEVLWLKNMWEASEFIVHLMDISEEQFIDRAEKYAHLFKELWIQAVNFQAALRLRKMTPALGRFLGETIKAMEELVAFNTTFSQLVARCQVLTLATPDFAEHVRSESLYFLEILRGHAQALGVVQAPAFKVRFHYR